MRKASRRQQAPKRFEGQRAQARARPRLRALEGQKVAWLAEEARGGTQRDEIAGRWFGAQAIRC